MIMPFSSAFLVNNILIPETSLSMIFFITGLFSIFTGPVLGKLSDQVGKYRMFLCGSLLSMIMIFVYTNLGPNPIWVVVTTNIIMWVGISSRMISSSALTSGVPDMKDRGAYMGINSSMQYFAGGVASFVAGLIVHQPATNAPLRHYNTVGYVTVGTMMITIIMMYFIDRQVAAKLHVLRA